VAAITELMQFTPLVDKLADKAALVVVLLDVAGLGAELDESDSYPRRV
jgi:hypothetical protein